MESIRDVLSKMTMPRATAGARTATSSNNSCPTCGGAGWLRLDVPVDDPRFGQTIPCACKSKVLEEKKMRALLERSNLKALQDKTFATFIARNQLHAYERAREFADHPVGWLVMLGDVGTGKTHLAAAIGNRRLELGELAIFIVVPDLLDYLRAAFSPTSDTPFDDLFHSVRDAPLLILDDLGTQTTTPWANEKLFQLLNHRYMSKLPTVITANVRGRDLGERLWSRMSDPDISDVIPMEGPDLRAPSDAASPRAMPSGGRTRPPQRGRP